jgi:predicted anti-sigma-YlaC factor YlaD
MTHRESNGSVGGPLGAHGECWNLLPWIANESAAARDMALVEEHLRDCRECQEELSFQRQLREAIRSEEAIVLAPQTSLQKLMQRIDSVADMDDEHEVAPAAAEPVVARRAPPRLRWLPIAAAVQGIAIAGLLAALWSQSRDELAAGRYSVLTTPTAAVAGGPVIRVVFGGNVALDDMNRVLRSIDAQIIAGPSEAGVYTLGLASGAADKSGVEKAIAQLRADGRVMFAEPAVASEAP